MVVEQCGLYPNALPELHKRRLVGQPRRGRFCIKLLDRRTRLPVIPSEAYKPPIDFTQNCKVQFADCRPLINRLEGIATQNRLLHSEYRFSSHHEIIANPKQI